MEIIVDKFQHVTNKQLAEEGRKRRLGYIFRKGEDTYWEGRCPICGEWVTHNFKKDVDIFIRNGQWDFKKKRMTHCAKNSLCSDWYHEWQKSKEHKSLELFGELMRRKLIV